MKLAPAQLQELLSRLREGLRAHYGDRLLDVRLYGSYARGNADEGSDVDILVILQGPTSEFIESEATADLVAGLSLEYDTIVCCMFLSEEDYRERDMAFYCVVRQESRSV